MIRLTTLQTECQESESWETRHFFKGKPQSYRTKGVGQADQNASAKKIAELVRGSGAPSRIRSLAGFEKREELGASGKMWGPSPLKGPPEKEKDDDDESGGGEDGEDDDDDDDDKDYKGGSDDGREDDDEGRE